MPDRFDSDERFDAEDEREEAMHRLLGDADDPLLAEVEATSEPTQVANRALSLSLLRERLGR